MTLNDHERRKGRHLRYVEEFGSFGANYIKLTEARPILLQQKYRPKNLISGNILS